MKKLLSVILAMVLLFSAMPFGLFSITARAAMIGTTGDCTWSLDGTVLTISGNGAMRDYINDRYVGIFEGSLSGNLNVTEIIVEEGVTSIGSNAFSGTESLKSITIPKSVSRIGAGAFEGCTSLEKVNITDIASWCNITFCGDPFANLRNTSNPVCYAKALYLNNNLITDLVIPQGVTTISYAAFICCESLRSVTIPESVVSIGGNAFYKCTSLEKVNITDIASWCNIDFQFDYEYDPVFTSNPLYYAGNLCLNNEPITNLIIPNGVKTINSRAFFCCEGIESVTFPISQLSIMEQAFYNCVNLKDVYYMGSKVDKLDLIISDATQFNALNWYYNSCFGATKHNYDNASSPKRIVGSSSSNTGHTYKTTTKKATVSKNGSIVKKCSVCGKVSSNTTIYRPKTINLSTNEYAYSGKLTSPEVKIYDSKGNKLTCGKDYTYSRPSSKNVGKYKIKVTFKGDYSGTKNLYYEINPKETSVSKLTAEKKKLKVKIKKQSTETTGYQIQYSTSKKFKGAKTKTVKGNKTTSCTLKSLKSEKTYYVRVRTYKTVDGKKYYSDWSKAVKKKTK